MSYCSECGAGVTPGSRYCSQCGIRQDDEPEFRDPSRPTPVFIPDTERVIQVIPNLLLVKGFRLFVRGEGWLQMVITSHRIIMVQRTVTGIGKFKRDLGMEGQDYGFLALKSMKPEDILRENPESVVIMLTDLVKLRISKYVSLGDEGDQEWHWQFACSTRDEIRTYKTEDFMNPEKDLQNPEVIRLLGDRLDTAEM